MKLLLPQTIDWINANQGLISIIIFLVTLLLGWTSGIFTTLRRKPKLKINLIDGPTFYSILTTGEKFRDHNVHRTVFALYIDIANIGSAATSIESVSIGYHWNLRPYSLNWVRYRIGWFWIHESAIALEDFRIQIGDSVKFFPFLFQRSSVSGYSTDTYLQIGQRINGVAYYEQADSWGGCQPIPFRGGTRVIVSIKDVFGRRTRRKFWIPMATLDDAKKFNPSFGETLSALRRGSSQTVE